MAESKPAKKGAQKSAKRTTATDNQRKRFTAEEQAAMDKDQDLGGVRTTAGRPGGRRTFGTVSCAILHVLSQAPCRDAS